MSGKKSTLKGDRYEREVVAYAREKGFSAVKIPRSGATQDFKNDVCIEGVDFECKRSKRPLSKALLNFLEEAEQNGGQGVITRHDRSKRHDIFMGLDTFMKMIDDAYAMERA